MLPLEDLTVGQFIDRTAQRYGERKAIWYHGEDRTYAHMAEKIRQYAALFAKLGVRRGENVAFWTEIEPEVLYAFYAIQRIGAVAVMVNTSLVSDELRDLLRRSDVKLLLAGRSFKTDKCIAEGNLETLAQAGVERVYSIGLKRMNGVEALRDLHGDLTEEHYAAAAAMEARVTPQDTATILFTSGSTSAPKGVMSSHYSRVNGGIQQSHDLHFTCEDKVCVAMPLFHCFCISVNVMAAMATGACLCVPDDRHISSILDTVETCGCTVLSSVPTMFHAMLARKKMENRDMSTVRIGFIGGAYYPPEDFIRIDEAMGPQFTLMSSLGQTECTAGLTTCYVEDSMEVRSTTVGHFMSHVEGRIADIKTGETLPLGEKGEICVRGYLNMQGYYKQPELTAQVIDSDGWVHTGDLGVLDEAGNVTLAGRLKELIIRGGENISPSEIEVVLSRLPGIKASKVVGVPDPHYGEEICACVIREEGSAVTTGEITEYLSAHLAYYKVPKYIKFFDSFPTTATGKIKPAEVRALAMEKLGLDRR